MRWVLLIPALALVAVGTTGCIEDPCAKLKPTTQERQVVESGGGVEREVDGTECELNDLDDGFVQD